MIQQTNNRVFTSPRVNVQGAGAANYDNGPWVAIYASTSEAQVLAGVFLYPGIGSIFDSGDIEIDVGVGVEDSEEVIATIPVFFSSDPGFYDGNHEVLLPIPVDAIPSGSRVSVRVRISDNWTANNTVGYLYYKKPLTGEVFTTTAAPQCAPSAALPISMTTPGGAWANSSYVTVIASAPSDLVIGGLYVAPTDVGIAEYEVDIRAGGNLITTYRGMTSADGGPSTSTFRIPVNNVSAGEEVSARFRCQNATSMTGRLKLWYYVLTTTSTSILTTEPVKWTTPAASGTTMTDGGGGSSPVFGSYGAWTPLIASTSAPVAVTAFSIGPGSWAGVWGDIQFGSGPNGSEVPVATFDFPLTDSGNAAARHIELPIPVDFPNAGTRICARTRTNAVTPFSFPISMGYIENPDFDHRGSMEQSYEPLGVVPTGLASNTSPNTNSAYQQLIASTDGDQLLGGITFVVDSGVAQDIDLEIAVGPDGGEVVIATLSALGAESIVKPERARMMLPVPVPIPDGSRMSYRFRQPSSDSYFGRAHIWLIPDIPDDDSEIFGTIGDLVWVHARRRVVS